MGVFQIRNIVNGKVFIGSSLNLDAIWNRNLSELRLGGHRNPKLQQEWNTFGEVNFVFEVLTELTQNDGATLDYGKEVREL